MGGKMSAAGPASGGGAAKSGGAKGGHRGKAAKHHGHGKSRSSFMHKLGGKYAPAPVKDDEANEDPKEEAGESRAQEDAEETVEQDSDDYTNGASHAELFQKRMSQKRSAK